jgi:hypothetical protein
MSSGAGLQLLRKPLHYLGKESREDLASKLLPVSPSIKMLHRDKDRSDDEFFQA